MKTLKRLGWVLPVMALGILAMGVPATAIEIQLGYVDLLRPSPFTPSPFFGDPSVQLFAGETPTSNMDSGAVRIHNDTGSDFVITSLTVHMRDGAGTLYDLWSGFLPVALHNGNDAIFVQTSGQNFDSSDHDQLGGIGPSATNNCSTGPESSSLICTSTPPQVILNGLISLDTGHTLDTGGFDSVNAVPCPNAAETAPNCNESLSWRSIGTCGLNCPGGNVPEPSSLVLLGSAVIAVGGFSLRPRVLKRLWRWSQHQA
jgi:hypothetical protein